MDCSTIGDDLRVDALVGHLAVEEVGDEFDDAKNKTGTHRSRQFHGHSIVDLGVLEDLSTGYRKDPGRGLRNGRELGKSRSLCPQKVDFDGS